MKIFKISYKTSGFVKINNCKNERMQHVVRVHRSITRQAAIKYQPAGNRNQELPLQRLLDCYIERRTDQEVQILCKHDDDDDAYLFGLRITLLHI
jgi:hypothetical protein